MVDFLLFSCFYSRFGPETCSNFVWIHHGMLLNFIWPCKGICQKAIHDVWLLLRALSAWWSYNLYSHSLYKIIQVSQCHVPVPPTINHFFHCQYKVNLIFILCSILIVWYIIHTHADQNILNYRNWENVSSNIGARQTPRQQPSNIVCTVVVSGKVYILLIMFLQSAKNGIISKTNRVRNDSINYLAACYQNKYQSEQ